MNPRQPADVFEFKGAAVLSNTIIATAAAAVISTGNDFDTVQLECTGHGYLAGSLIYLSGFIAPLKYLNGLKMIYAVATNTFDVRVRPGQFVAGTPAGTEVARVAITMDERYLTESIEIHLNTACATVEDLEVNKDAASGSQFDYKPWDRAMNTEKDKDMRWDPKLECNANDLMVVTWANANSRTWGIKLIARRLA